MKTFLIVMSLTTGPEYRPGHFMPDSVREMPGRLSCDIAAARLREAAEDPLKGRVLCVAAKKEYD